ncbi:MAG: hypothetical protein INR71_04540, partial [Terriglobus roseus]|nr:hypothetical protein [Terriglobus roseus]
MQAAAAQPFSNSLFGDNVISAGTKLGTMKNSYFKLKSMGVQVDSDEEENAAAAGHGKKRAFEESLGATDLVTKRRVSPALPAGNTDYAAKYRHLLGHKPGAASATSLHAQAASSRASPDVAAEDEALFARLRKVRDVMDESTAWYKEEREKDADLARSRSSSTDFRRSGGSASAAPTSAPAFTPYQPPAGNYGASVGSASRHTPAGSPPRGLPKFWGRESFFVKREDYGKSKAQREDDRKQREREKRQRDAEDARLRAETERREADAARLKAERQKEEDARRERELEDEKKRLANAAAEALERKGEKAFGGRAAAAPVQNPFAKTNGSGSAFAASSFNAANSSAFGKAAAAPSPFANLPSAQPFGGVANPFGGRQALPNPFARPPTEWIPAPAASGQSPFGQSPFGQPALGGSHARKAAVNGVTNGDSNGGDDDDDD